METNYKPLYKTLEKVLGVSLVNNTIKWGAIHFIAEELSKNDKGFSGGIFVDKIMEEKNKYEETLRKVTELYKPVDENSIKKRPKYYIYCRECRKNIESDDIEEMKAFLINEGWKTNTATKHTYCRYCYENLIANEIKNEGR